MSTAPTLAGPLDGIRVLDFTNVLAGPYCTRLLADLGAEVIKIEAREGDQFRHRPPIRNGRSSIFGHVNCGKKSVVLDLKSAAGREAAFDLGMKADVVAENWRPGIADRLGVGYQAFAQAKPDIVYCSISGYGQGGPKAMLPAYAHIIHAASGFDLTQMALDDAEKPQRTGMFLADVFAGFSAFAAIQTALFQRQRTGRGQFIDVALMDCMLNLPIFEIQLAQFAAPSRRILRSLRAADGFMCIAPFSDRIFRDMMRAIGHPEWIEDPRFKEEPTRDRNWDEMLSCVETWTRPRPAAECEKVLLAAEVPCSRYRTVAEAIADEHVLGRGTLATVKDKAGEYLVSNTPFRMPGAMVKARARVPDLGEDSVEILSRVLGYSADRVKACVPK